VKRCGWLLLLAAACAGRMGQIRKTASGAMSCPGDALWVIDDGASWSTAGCGQIASGVDPEHVNSVSSATCESLADFEFRMCLLVARQRAVTAGGDNGNVTAQAMEGQDGQACYVRRKERTDSCLKEPPPRKAQPAVPAPAAPFEPPAAGP
jgi:hypothetical protein